MIPLVDGSDFETVSEPLGERVRRRRLEQRLFGIDSEPVCVGRFVLLRELAAGGSGVVYEARDPGLERTVAVKVLRPEARDQQERLLREARSLARLSHPNVVTVHEVGTFEGGVYVAMELVEGRTLRQWLDQPRSTAEIVSVLLQAARGLEAAHARGVVHRDFKPENILVGNDGRVRVVDLGLAGAAASSTEGPAATDGAIRLTQSGDVMGTPAYMAPEQFRGVAIDPRADQFAFCVVAHEALAGSRPFPGDDFQSIRARVLAGDLGPPPRAVPRALWSVIERGLEREPSARHTDMGRVIERLESWTRSRRSRRQRWALAAVVATGAFAWAHAIATTSRQDVDADAPEALACQPFDRGSVAVEVAGKQLTMLRELMHATRTNDPEYVGLQLRAAELLLTLGRDAEACDTLDAANADAAAPDARRAMACLSREFCGQKATSCGDSRSEQHAACLDGDARCCGAAAIAAEFACLESRGADASSCSDVVELTERACRAGSAPACRSGARWLQRWNPDDRRAVQRFHQLACEHGDQEACASRGGDDEQD
jgi:predicted Ser/Thr protein kinase